MNATQTPLLPIVTDINDMVFPCMVCGAVPDRRTLINVYVRTATGQRCLLLCPGCGVANYGTAIMSTLHQHGIRVNTMPGKARAA